MERTDLLELTVAEALNRWPQTVQVLLRHRTACVGCVMAPFETLTDVAVVYGLPAPQFLNELQQTVQPREDRL